MTDSNDSNNIRRFVFTLQDNDKNVYTVPVEAPFWDISRAFGIACQLVETREGLPPYAGLRQIWVADELSTPFPGIDPATGWVSSFRTPIADSSPSTAPVAIHVSLVKPPAIKTPPLLSMPTAHHDGLRGLISPNTRSRRSDIQMDLSGVANAKEHILESDISDVLLALRELRPVSSQLFDPWWSQNELYDRENAAQLRRDNLARFLAERRGVKILLVGEASGYRGCRFSGIAFTSERQIMQGLLGPGYVLSSLNEKGWAESSSKIVWDVVQNFGADVAMWNTVPWHPHTEDVSLSNRTPSKAERAAGREVYDLVVKVFQPELVVGVGRVAAQTLDVDAVRHPARGGANIFRTQVSEILSKLA